MGIFDVLERTEVDPAVAAALAKVRHWESPCPAPLLQSDLRRAKGETVCGKTVVNVDAGVGGGHARKVYCSEECARRAGAVRRGHDHGARTRRRAAARALREQQAQQAKELAELMARIEIEANKRDRAADVRDLARAATDAQIAAARARHASERDRGVDGPGEVRPARNRRGRPSMTAALQREGGW